MAVTDSGRGPVRDADTVEDDDNFMVSELVEITDLSPMPFGKHQGEPLKDLPAHYVCWLYNEADLSGYPGFSEWVKEAYEDWAADSEWEDR